MKRIFFLTIIILLYCSQVFGQNKVIRGIVCDISSNEKLIGATVYDLTQRQGCITDQYGSFNISSKKDSLLLRFSFVGYQTDTILLYIQKDTILKVKMRKGVSIDELVITSRVRDNLYSHNLRNSELSNLPSIGGEIDILKSFAMFPGIQSGNEGSSDLYVRGGEKGENLILIDNIPLYYVNHLGSFVSVFNPEIINHVTISKYGFTPSFGGRLSSVLEIVLREGNSEKISGQGSVGLISSKLSIDGPISDKLTFLVSYRRTYADVFTRTFMALMNDNFSLGYNFYDFNFKITYKIDEKNTVHVFNYLGDDNLSFRYKNRKEDESSRVKNIWGNAVISLNLNTFLNSRWQLRNDLYFTRYRKRDDFSYELKNDNLFNFHRTIISGVRDIGFKSNISYTPIGNYTVQFGSDLKYHQFVPSEIIYFDRIRLAELVSTRELEAAFHLNNKINYNNIIFQEAGLRATYYSGFEETQRLFFEPRYKSTLNISRGLTVILSYDRMHQFVHNLNSSGNIINAEIWIPVSDQLPASVSDQVSGGFLYSFLESKHQFSINIYRKWYSNLINFKAGEISLAGDKNWENRIATNGSGSAEGIEFLLQRNAGSITGLLAYTFSKSKRKFIELNNGNPFVSDFDRPHDITLNLNYSINEKYNINLLCLYKSGLPVTLPVGAHYSLDLNGTISNNPFEAFIYSDKNEYRMRPYHRMDLAFSYKKLKKGKEIRWDFSIYNVYNRFNPYFLFVESDESKKMIIKEQSFFPIIPSLSYQIKF